MKAIRFAAALFALAAAVPVMAQVPYDRLVKADSEPGNWLTYGGNYYDQRLDRKSTRLNSSHPSKSRMPSSA